MCVEVSLHLYKEQCVKLLRCDKLIKALKVAPSCCHYIIFSQAYYILYNMQFILSKRCYLHLREYIFYLICFHLIRNVISFYIQFYYLVASKICACIFAVITKLSQNFDVQGKLENITGKVMQIYDSSTELSEKKRIVDIIISFDYLINLKDTYKNVIFVESLCVSYKGYIK